MGISGFLLGSRYLRLQGLAFDCNAPKSLVSEVLRADAHAQLEIISPHRRMPTQPQSQLPGLQRFSIGLLSSSGESRMGCFRGPSGPPLNGWVLGKKVDVAGKQYEDRPPRSFLLCM